MIISEKTVTSIFFVPTLGIKRQDLYENNFLNGYLEDVDKDQYYEEDVCFLLFKPEDLTRFRAFLDEQYEKNKNIIEDYDPAEGYVVLVYNLNPKLSKDFLLVKNSKYSLVSEQFKEMFPKKVQLLNRPNKPWKTSLQWMIFEKDEQLIQFIEKKIGQSLPEGTNVEVWPGFEYENQILDIDKIVENGGT